MIGLRIGPVRREVTQATIDAYAEASGDFNPLHLDPEFAAKTMFGGTIAHGLLSAGFLSELMQIGFGAFWAAGGDLEIRFRAPVRPGDVVQAWGELEAIADGVVACKVWCENQRGEQVIVGTARVEPVSAELIGGPI